MPLVTKYKGVPTWSKIPSFIGLAEYVKTYFVLVLLSHIIDRFLLGDDDILSTVTTGFYIANEAMSIIENVGKVGLPLPPKVAGLSIYF